VIAKFNRSSELFDQLNEEMDTFFNRDPAPFRSVGALDLEAVRRLGCNHPAVRLKDGWSLGTCWRCAVSAQSEGGRHE
jgi:hypothetical protein